MTLTKSGYFGYAGGGKNGAVVDAWLASRFVGAPAEDSSPPTGTADAGPVTTTIAFGGPGSYLLTMPSAADYYIRIQYGNHAYWSFCSAGSIGGQAGGGGGGGGAGASLLGWVPVTGLVSDGGITDNTAALIAAFALLPASGGTLVLPSGKFGCNWNPPQGITLLGQGNGNPTNPGSTILCGLNSLSGNQIAPIQRTNANVTLTNFTIDGGGATDISYAPLQSYSCLFACYDNAVDTSTFDMFFLGGTTTSWFQDTGSGRPNSSLVRCTNNYGGATSLAAHGKNQRTIVGNGTSAGITINGTATITTDAGHPFILPPLAGGTLGGDVGRAIVAVGLPLGTYITAVASPTSATVNQPATASASFITAQIFQGEATFLAGTDNQIAEIRSTNGTTRLAGGGGNQIDIAHFTLTGSSGTMPPSTTFEAGMWSLSTLYSDSSVPNGGNIVHTVGAKQSLISNLMGFQNSPNATVFITENDTVNSLTISGGGLANKNSGGGALNFTTFLNLAGGSNPSFTCDGPFWASNQSLDKTGSIPNLVTGGTPGRMVFNYSVTGSGSGALFSIGPLQAGSGLVAGAKIYSGVGAPNIPESLSGDYYFRTGTPLTANQRLYIATAANTWTGIL